MTRPARTNSATYDDLLRTPDHLVAEILEGELCTSPRPSLRHALVHTNLIPILHGPFSRGRGGPGGWWILLEPELHLNTPTDVVVPDLAGWRVQRMMAPPEDHRVTLAPDWICEVMSPSTARMDRTRKLRIYARAGVRHAWLLDAAQHTLDAFALEGDRWVLVHQLASDGVGRIEPFEAIDVRLSELWQEPTFASVPER